MLSEGTLSRIVEPFIHTKREQFSTQIHEEKPGVRLLSSQELSTIGGSETVPFLPSSTFCYLTSCNLLHLEFCGGDDRAIDAE